MKARIIVILAWLIVTNFVSASGKIYYDSLLVIANKDSIARRWVGSSDESLEKLHWILSLEKAYYIESSAQAGQFLDTIKKIEKKLYPSGTSGLYSFFLASKYVKENRLYEAYNSFSEAIAKFRINKDSFGLAHSLISISTLPNSGNAASSDLAGLVEAEKIALSLKQTKLLIRLYMAYLRQYMSNAAERTKEIDGIFKKLKAAIKGKKDEHWGLAYFNTNVGTLALTNNKFAEAISYYKEAQKYYQDVQDESGKMLNFYNMALAYYYLQDFSNSKIATDFALAIAKKNFFLTDQKNCYNLKVEIYRSTKELALCLASYDSFFILHDSLIQNERSSELNEIRTKYHAQELELSNEHLKTEEIHQAKIKNYLLGFLLFLVFALAVFTYLYITTLRQKTKISHQKQALEELTQTKDYFLAIMAHDIKQPIVSLFGLNKTLKYYAQTNNFDKIDKLIKSIDRSSMKTLKIIDNLFHWSFIQNKDKIHNPVRLNLKATIEEIISRFILDQSELDLTLEIDDSIFVFFDVVDFEIVVRNLLDNSIKFTSTTKNAKICIFQESMTDQKVTICFKDNGVGISQEIASQIEQIFSDPSPFHPKVYNMGFGIILISQLMIPNRSKISLVSTSEQGTEIRLTLNLK